MGGPTKYTEKLAQEICERLANGESLRKICLDDKMPTRACILSWAVDMKHPFFDQYARARDIQADSYADEINDIADESDPGDKAGVLKARLQVDARKWVASKLKPKRYADKLVQEHQGKDGGPISVSALDSMSDLELELLAKKILLKKGLTKDEPPSDPQS